MTDIAQTEPEQQPNTRSEPRPESERPSELHIAILGAGPTGLEAALAAVDAGISFTLYEAEETVAGYIRDWGHVRLFSPWSLDVSPRMRRHLEAAGHELPSAEDDTCPTGAELAERVLFPIAELEAVKPHVRTGVRVLAVGRERLVKNDEIGTGRRQEQPFRLLLGTIRDREWAERADVVLDCTGTYGNPNALGDGGIPAPGEAELEPYIVRCIPDFAGNASRWAGRTVLLVGAGHSAQTAVRDLAELAADAAGTEVYWSLRNPEPQWMIDEDDPLPERAALTARARDLARGASAAVETIPGTVVDRIERLEGKVGVYLRSVDGSIRTVAVDRVLALTGGVGDHTLYRQLQVHECYATSGPMNLAAALLGEVGGDCLTQESHGVDTLKNPEPNFYLLGSKSYGRNTTFLMRVGWEQVEEVFEELAAELSVERVAL